MVNRKGIREGVEFEFIVTFRKKLSKKCINQLINLKQNHDEKKVSKEICF